MIAIIFVLKLKFMFCFFFPKNCYCPEVMSSDKLKEKPPCSTTKYEACGAFKSQTNSFLPFSFSALKR